MKHVQRFFLMAWGFGIAAVLAECTALDTDQLSSPRGDFWTILAACLFLLATLFALAGTCLALDEEFASRWWTRWLHLIARVLR